MIPARLLAALILVAGLAPAAEAGRTWVVAQAHPAAGDDRPGTEEAPLRTIQAAASQAQPGDLVLVRAGIYRERVAPPRGGEAGRPITYRAAPGERVQIVGSDPWSPTWSPVPSATAVWRAPLPALPATSPYRTGFRCGWNAKKQEEPVVRPAEGPRLRQTLGQLIVAGELLIQVEHEAMLRQPGTWMVDAAGEAVLAHLPGDGDPARAAVELTVRDRLFAPLVRGLGHIRVEGFAFAFCANQGPWPTRGAVSVRAGHHWTIAGCTVRFCTSIGIDAGSEHWDPWWVADPEFKRDVALRAHDITVRGNLVADNGLTGIFAMELRGDSLIAGNRIERNNRGGYAHGDTGWEEWGGLKLMCSNARIEGNLVADNDGHGIWLDNHVRGARVTRNVVLNNQRTGIFLEFTNGRVLVDSNLVAGTRSGGGFYPGHGIYSHDASDVTVAHNLVVDNAGSGVLMRTVTDRVDGHGPTRPERPRRVLTAGQRVYGNVLAANRGAAIALPWPDGLNIDNRSDANLILHAPARPFAFAELNLKAAMPMAEVLGDFGRWYATQADAGPAPDAAQWAARPDFSPLQWSRLMGNDATSVIEPRGLAIRLRSLLPVLRIEGAEQLKPGLTCPDEDLGGQALETDLLGRPYPAAAARLPGPIQGLAAGLHELPLWPLP